MSSETASDARVSPEPGPLDRVGHNGKLPDRGPAGLAATLTEHRWLFPGRRPDRPAHPATLMSRLARHDIPLRLARNAALLHLARERPPIIVVDLLGVRVNTA